MNLDWLNFLAGVGIFLWGMSLIESSLSKLASGKLNHYLSSWTKSTFSAILVGAACTTVVQSSSLVTLIVLALASSKLLNLKQAVGVIFGANLGTTATGWLVTFLGFKFNLGEFAIYLIGIAALGRVFLAKRTNQIALYSLFISIGLILFSFDIIKTGTIGLSQNFDITEIQSQSTLLFVLIGLILAALVQSSSAVMMMTLGAANAGLLDLQSSIAVVIGADIGTTSTAILGSVKGAKIKKQLALAHLLFNFAIAIIGFFMLLPFIEAIFKFLKIHDLLISIVTFHSLLKLIGIILFYPFINRFVQFLSTKFEDKLSPVETRLSLIPTDMPPVAIERFRSETISFINRVSQFNQKCLSTDVVTPEHYSELKKMEGLFIKLSRQLSERPLTQEQTQSLYNLLTAIRHGIYSAKLLKDLLFDLEQPDLAESYHDKSTFPIFNQSKAFYEDSRNLFDQKVDLSFEDFNKNWYEQLFHEFKTSEANLLTSQISHNISVDIISTLLNLNKSLYKSCKYYMQALESIDKTIKETNHEN
ncbi:Na/Pi cotransporter family protein [Kangiella koreensis]|uniref:Na+/Picotransporter n=1 Tax=Kangiella koreensis (strain DSM 16069 / JCM 12317 / KCTC 12182 / SW-125) TaxID=523791 RepID=C7RBY7_KANKD|nr:Na/Pi symporter [Kangiella koreensis]ACV26779.1 Na+/Picotransporter [Kangiella koreensis DSM 16069]